MSTITGGGAAALKPPFWAPLRRLYDRKLPNYPSTGARAFYLGPTVLATIGLYYELYIQRRGRDQDHPALRIHIHRVRVRAGWVCFAGQLVFIPALLFVTGRWNPRRAKEDELEHERMVERELAKLHAKEA